MVTDLLWDGPPSAEPPAFGTVPTVLLVVGVSWALLMAVKWWKRGD